jgi:hypothetical protein
MARILAAVAAVAMGSTAWAQEAAFGDPVLGFIGADAVEKAPKLLSPEFGIRAGYFKVRDADDGAWFGGVQVRIPLSEMFAIEGAIELHTTEFEDGEIEVVQYPLQASLLLFLMPQSAPISPYVLAGVGWYYTIVDFSGSLSGFDGDTDHWFGGHIGAGARALVGKSMAASADVRYIFIEPDGNNLEDENFDTFQISLSLSFQF